jgi:hypothetical protein
MSCIESTVNNNDIEEVYEFKIALKNLRLFDSSNPPLEPINYYKQQLSNLILLAQNKCDAAVTGSNPQQYPSENKAALSSAIEDARNVKNTGAAIDQFKTAIQQLNDAIASFDSSKNPEADKSVLAALISEARSRHASAVEGTEPLQYASGSKSALMSAINSAQVGKDNIYATEDQVSDAVTALSNALDIFISRRVSVGIQDVGAIVEAAKPGEDPLSVIAYTTKLTIAASERVDASDSVKSREYISGVNSFIKRAAPLVASLESTEERLEAFTEIMKAVETAVQKADLAGPEGTRLNQLSAGLAGKLLEKEASVVLSRSTGDKKIYANLSPAAVTELTGKLTKIEDLSIKLQDKLTSAGIKETVEKRALLDIPAAEGINSFEAELPDGLLNSMKSKSIDTVKLAAGALSMEFKPDVLGGSGGQPVKLSVNTKHKPGMVEVKIHAFTGSSQGSSSDYIALKDRVLVKVQYSPQSGEDTKNITVMYIDSQNREVNMSGWYDGDEGAVLFYTDHFSTFIVKSNPVSFKDISEGFWGEEAINVMAAKGIVSGKPGGKYDPDGTVTRAEFVKLVACVMNSVDDAAVSKLADVSESKWYYKYVASAEKAGLINAAPGTEFSPEENISRYDMAMILYNAIKQPSQEDYEKFTGFSDTGSLSKFSKSRLATVVKNELMLGNNGKFRPEDTASRAEAAQVVYRLYKIIKGL